jgi:ribosomal protein S18 acetylase RimI-like enzyme
MPKTKIIIQGPFLEKADLCEPVLQSLPEWFGIEDANLHYLDAIDRLPTFLAMNKNQVMGFLTILQHYPKSAEVFVAGVLPQYHRRGIGRALLRKAEAYLSQQGVEYLQVKTLSESHPDEGYAQTRAFYLAMGFQPLEELKTLWDEANPALLLVKKL